MHATASRSIPRAPIARPRLHSQRSLLDGGDWLVIVLGLSDAFMIHLIGDLPIAEILGVLVLPFLIAKDPKIFSRRGTRTFLLLAALWIFSQVISDLVNGSPIQSRLKGIARVLFFAMDFAVFSALIGRNTKRIVLLAVSLGTAQMLRLPSFGLSLDATYWKSGGSAAISVMFMLVGSYLCYKRRYGLFVVCTLALMLLNFHEGYRSQIAVDLLALGVTLPIFLGAKRIGGGKQSNKFRVIPLLIVSFGAVWLSQKIISEGVKHGLFDESVQQKFQAQSSGQLGVLVGARPEIPVALRAIADAPIFGHGSYAVDPKYLFLLQDYQYRFGYSGSDDPGDLEDPGIPTHSHLTMSWVEGGVLASFLWFYLLYLIVRAMLVVSAERPPLAPYYAFVFLTLGWDILFSPFGFDRRIFEAFYTLLLINLLFDPVQQAAKSVGKRIVVSRRQVVRATPNPLRPASLPRPRPSP
jgi:hypothetical protein